MKKYLILLVLFFAAVQYSSAQSDSISKAPEVFNLVEIMPSWKGCETQKSEEKKIECTKREISEFITKNIQYPENAKKNKTKGTVFVTFVIDREGNVVSPKIIRGINDELDTEAMRVINLIPAFNPGLQRGKPVQVQYNIPVKFPPN